MKSRHAELVREAVKMIQAHGGLAVKLGTGSVQLASGRRMQTGRKGWPDVVACWPMHSSSMAGLRKAVGEEHTQIGRFLAVEVKVGRDPLSKDQQRIHAELRQRGALVVVVRDDLQALKDALT